MDRKWRLNREALQTVESIIQFQQKYIQEWQYDAVLASLTDLYAVYTVLHIERKRWELHYSSVAKGYYFVTTQNGTDTVPEQTIVVPEGDEDMVVIQTEEGIKDTKETVFQTETVQPRQTTRQIVVPVSSSCTEVLTPRVIHTMCSLGHALAQQVIMCLVDSHGVVTRCCVYDYIQAPLGGTGEALLNTPCPALEKTVE